MALYLLTAAFVIATILACTWHEYAFHLGALACLIGAAASVFWLDDHGFLPDAAALQARNQAMHTVRTP
jgi:hypothetical protein